MYPIASKLFIILALLHHKFTRMPSRPFYSSSLNDLIGQDVCFLYLIIVLQKSLY